MSNWAATCAVSRLAIEPGDDVLWVYIKDKHTNTTYELSRCIWRYYDRMNDWKRLQQKDNEFLKRFPDSKEELQNYSLAGPEPSKIFEFGFGKYDDYGWVEEQDLPDEYENSSFLVRKDVADKMSEFGKTLISREWDGRMPFLKETYIYPFVLLCSLTRIQLFNHKLLGRQYPNGDEMREQRKVRSIINAEFQKQAKEIRERELEYKEWSKGV